MCARQVRPLEYSPLPDGREPWLPSAAGDFSAPATGTVLFDIANVKIPERRLSAWTDALNEHYYSLDVASPAETFDVGRMHITDVASLRVGALECDPMTVYRRPGHIADKGGEFYMIPFTTRSPLLLTQFDREGRFEPGDVGFVATHTPYIYDQPMRDRFTALRVPTCLVKDRVPYADDLTATVFSGGTPMVAIFLNYARSCLKYGPELTDEQPGVLRCLMDLFALAISASNSAAMSAETSVRVAHRHRALRFIEANFASPDLHSGTVARALRLSPRYLQKIFADRGETLSRLIRARRIAEARRLLECNETRKASVAQVAYAVGFDDVAHFSRTFREITGVAPSAYRGT
jgi:AraC-like DNA-binding protein